jgi:hypothetical protein
MPGIEAGRALAQAGGRAVLHVGHRRAADTTVARAALGSARPGELLVTCAARGQLAGGDLRFTLRGQVDVPGEATFPLFVVH